MKFSASTNQLADICRICGKRAYPMERITVSDGESFHKACLKCAQCGNVLSLGNYAALEGKYYCKPHYQQLFKLKGNYEEGFGHKRRNSFSTLRPPIENSAPPVLAEGYTKLDSLNLIPGPAAKKNKKSGEAVQKDYTWKTRETTLSEPTEPNSKPATPDQSRGDYLLCQKQLKIAQSQLEDQKEKCKLLSNQLLAAQTESSSYKENLETLRKEYDKLLEQCQKSKETQNEEIRQLRGNNEKLVQELNKLQTQPKTIDGEKDDSKLKKLTKTRASPNIVKDQAQQIQSAQNEITSLQETIQRQAVQVSILKELQVKYDTTVKSKTELEEECKDLKEQLKLLRRNEFKTAKRNSKELDKSQAKLQSELEAIKNELEEAIAKRDELQGLYDVLKAQTEESSKDSTHQNLTLSNEMTILKTKLEAYETIAKEEKEKTEEEEKEGNRRLFTVLTETRLLENSIYFLGIQTVKYDPDKGISRQLHLILGHLITGDYFKSKGGNYFLDKVVRAIDGMYKRSPKNQSELVVWLSFASGLLNGVQEKFLGKDLSCQVNGLKFLGKEKIVGGENMDPVQKFVKDLEHLTHHIYNYMLINIYSKLRSFLIPSLLAKPTSGSKIKPIIQVLTDDCIKLFKEQYLYNSIVQQFLHQVFKFINCVVFNELMDNGEKYCAHSQGFELKLRVSNLQNWASKNVKIEITDDMAHVLQVANIIIMDKGVFGDRDTVRSICPDVNFSQIEVILDSFVPEKPDTVLQQVRQKIHQFAEQESKQSPRPKIRLNEMENII